MANREFTLGARNWGLPIAVGARARPVTGPNAYGGYREH